MKRRSFWAGIGLASFLAGCCCGCQTVVSGTPTAATSCEASAPAVEFGERLLQSILNNNFDEFKACVGVESDIKTAEDFEQSQNVVRKQFGRMTSFEYVTCLKTPLVENMVWKVTFIRKGAQNNDIEQQLLFRLLLGQLDGKSQILGMGFI